MSVEVCGVQKSQSATSGVSLGCPAPERTPYVHRADFTAHNATAHMPASNQPIQKLKLRRALAPMFWLSWALRATWCLSRAMRPASNTCRARVHRRTVRRLVSTSRVGDSASGGVHSLALATDCCDAHASSAQRPLGLLGSQTHRCVAHDRQIGALASRSAACCVRQPVSHRPEAVRARDPRGRRLLAQPEAAPGTLDEPFGTCGAHTRAAIARRIVC